MGRATQKTFQQQVNNVCDEIPELITLDGRDCVDPEVVDSVRGLKCTEKAHYQAFIIKDVVVLPYKNNSRHHQEQQLKSVQKI